MEKYTIKYMETHCIDLFFVCEGLPIHVITAGSIIPDALNDIGRNRTLQEETEKGGGGDSTLASALPAVTVVKNETYIKSLQERHHTMLAESSQNATTGITLIPSSDDIASHFCFYARQGFYSYDCSEVMVDGDAIYTLMSWPDKPCPTSLDLPQFTPQNFVISDDGLPVPKAFKM